MKRSLKLLAAVAALLLAFFVGRVTAPASPPSPAEAMVRWSETPGWVEVTRGGEVVSEWQEADGERFWVLVDLLGD